MPSPRSVVLISTVEKSTGGGAAGAGCCCAKAFPASHRVVEATAMAVRIMKTLRKCQSSRLLAQECMACRVAGDKRACFNAPSEAGAAKRPNEENWPYDVTIRGRRGLRPAPGRPASHEPVALSERLLARPGDHARHDRPGVAILSDPFADLSATRLAAGKGQAGIEP